MQSAFFIPINANQALVLNPQLLTAAGALTSGPGLTEVSYSPTSNTVAQYTPDEIGLTLGSTLGSLLAHGNSLAAIPISTGLGITLGALAGVVESSVGGDISGLVGRALSNVPGEVAAMGASAITSYLTAEALNALGVKGFAAQALNVASNVTIAKIAANLATGQDPLADIGAPANFAFAVGSFIGSEVGAAILPAETQEESLGGSLGSAVTAILATNLLAFAPGVAAGTSVGAAAGSGAAITLAGPAAAGTTVGNELATSAAVQGVADALGIEAGTLLNFAVPVVGALVGYLVGTEFGGLIGGTPSPQAWATIGVQRTGSTGATFAVENTDSKDDGPVALVDNLAQSTTGALNAILAEIGGKVVRPGAVTPFYFGVRRGVASFRTGLLSNDYHFADVGQLQTYVVANSLNQLLTGGGIAGGDVFVKRAVVAFLGQALTNPGYNPLANGQNASPLISGNLSALTGDIAIAQSYEQYRAAPAIDALIAESPDSAFAAGWLVTLQAADALGLNRRSSSDWTGGWGGYLASLGADPEQLQGGLVGNVRTLAVAGTVIPDTISSAGKDTITDTAANDTISVNQTGTLAADANAVFDGVAASAAQASHIAAVIYAGSGHAKVYAGGQGDDVVGGTGGDYLAAGSLVAGAFVQSQNATWLFGGVGNDTLQGGASGGDRLQGGTGNDLILAGSGSAWLAGGVGNDTLVGSSQGDILQAGQGSTLIEAGSGSDTIVFGYGDGTATVTNSGGANDELSLGAGIGFQNIQLVRPLVAGTSTPSNNLELELLGANQVPTGDEITLVNWFLPQDRVQWLRFDNGTKVQLGDFNIVFGTAANNNLLGVPGNNWLVAGPGYATIDAWLGDGVLDAGVGQDFISGGPGNDTILGAAGDDTLFGGFGGNDYIQGGAGSDILIASTGADTLVAGTGGDTIFGGGGNDVFEYGRGDGQDVLGNPLTMATATVVWNPSGWTNGYHWQHYATGAADGGGYDAVTNGTNVIIDTREFGSSATGLNGYLEYDRTNQLLYYWSSATAAAEPRGGAASTLSFGAGISASNLTFQWSGSDLVLGVRANGDLSTPVSQLSDTLRLLDYANVGSAIQTLQFADGTTLNLNATSIVASHSDGAETLVGGAASAENALASSPDKSVFGTRAEARSTETAEPIVTERADVTGIASRELPDTSRDPSVDPNMVPSWSGVSGSGGREDGLRYGWPERTAWTVAGVWAGSG